MESKTNREPIAVTEAMKKIAAPSLGEYLRMTMQGRHDWMNRMDDVDQRTEQERSK